LIAGYRWGSVIDGVRLANHVSASYQVSLELLAHLIKLKILYK